jgi:hypothetical protein
VYQASYDFTMGLIDMGMLLLTYVWPFVLLGAILMVVRLAAQWSGLSAGAVDE